VHSTSADALYAEFEIYLQGASFADEIAPIIFLATAIP
jgi:hypothetical protein